MSNTVSIGDYGEALALVNFLSKGAIVSKPLSNNARYDLVVEINHKIYRVQVKATNAVKDGKMEFATKTTNYTKGSWKSVPYSTRDIDIFFLYCVENNWCGLYIVQDSDESIPQQLNIRLDPPKNNQKIGIRLAEDYCFEAQYQKLIDEE